MGNRLSKEGATNAEIHCASKLAMPDPHTQPEVFCRNNRFADATGRPKDFFHYSPAVFDRVDAAKQGAEKGFFSEILSIWYVKMNHASHNDS